MIYISSKLMHVVEHLHSRLLCGCCALVRCILSPHTEICNNLKCPYVGVLMLLLLVLFSCGCIDVQHRREIVQKIMVNSETMNT